MAQPLGLTTTVMVPTFERPLELARCFQALLRQTHAADQLIVVRRSGDASSDSVIAEANVKLPITIVALNQSSLVAALNAGLLRATGDIVLLTDDDAAPREDWLEAVVSTFMRNPSTGAVGGRDEVHNAESKVSRKEVGVLRWYGKLVGNHHVGFGPVRHVHFLKGVNLAFRLRAVEGLQFDGRLRGETNWEPGFCMAIRERGWDVIYDPSIVVDHYPAPKRETVRDEFSSQAMIDAVHNETLVALDNIPVSAIPVFIVWAVAVGTRGAPGAAQGVRLAPQRGRVAFTMVWAAWRGRWLGFKTWIRRKAPASTGD